MRTERWDLITAASGKAKKPRAPTKVLSLVLLLS